MAKCASLHQIFEKPLPPNPTLLESLSSWRNHISSKPPDLSSFTELFGELHFKDHSPCLLDQRHHFNQVNATDILSDDESPRNQQVEGVNLQLCTEGIGFESFLDVERNENVVDDDHEGVDKRMCVRRQASLGRKLRYSKSFPPPISSIGGNGKPWLYFRSFRRDGRFILRQVRIPTQVFFNAYREDGRLRLHPVRQVKQSSYIEDVQVKEQENNDGVHEFKIDAEEERGVENQLIR